MCRICRSFSHNKSVNSTFNHGFSGKRKGNLPQERASKGFSLLRTEVVFSRSPDLKDTYTLIAHLFVSSCLSILQ
ncbi:hypothetical protein BDA96_09G189300 [Sorghum bicolor]|uniref:Uncharacterized protein n=1 Tax=Sorghum bicolor TaxID=4558 RepID=A0A921QBC6_SORBI|nr:hypothetical protein BDA96_09G189300 [Sorghum bicolor]